MSRVPPSWRWHVSHPHPAALPPCRPASSPAALPSTCCTPLTCPPQATGRVMFRRDPFKQTQLALTIIEKALAQVMHPRVGVGQSGSGRQVAEAVLPQLGRPGPGTAKAAPPQPPASTACSSHLASGACQVGMQPVGPSASPARSSGPRVQKRTKPKSLTCDFHPFEKQQVGACLEDVVRTRLFVRNLARDGEAISRAHGNVRGPGGCAVVQRLAVGCRGAAGWLAGWLLNPSQFKKSRQARRGCCADSPVRPV